MATFAAIGIAFTLLLVTIGSGQWRWAAILYIGANLGFAGVAEVSNDQGFSQQF